MIWHSGITGALCIELFGIIGQMKEKEEEFQLGVVGFDRK